MRKRRGVIALILFVIVVLLGLVIAIGGGKLFSVSLNNTRDVGDTANSFMVALRDKKLDNAYGMLTSDLQQQKSKADFLKDFTGNSIKDWKLTHSSIDNDLGYVEGTATDNDGNHYVAFQLLDQNNKWMISGYKVGTFGWVGTVSDPAK